MSGNYADSTDEKIRDMTLSGETAASIKEFLEGVSLYHIRKIRSALFAELNSDPARVKALADGHILNPLRIVRYRDHSAPKGFPPQQLDIVDWLEARA